MKASSPVFPSGSTLSLILQDPFGVFLAQLRDYSDFAVVVDVVIANADPVWSFLQLLEEFVAYGLFGEQIGSESCHQG
ncbi:MAG: hypothetical protein NWE84_07415 [Candidatus Bathyarchaeota archaeon]|nr:hypothetical protein [Candidatus Bathyarchaeota archaeon]